LIYRIEEVKERIEVVYMLETLEYMLDLMKVTLNAIKNSDMYTEMQLLKLIRERNDELWRFTYDLLLSVERVGEIAAGRQLDIRLAKLKLRSKNKRSSKNAKYSHVTKRLKLEGAIKHGRNKAGLRVNPPL